jgi:hypothetical protein
MSEALDDVHDRFLRELGKPQVCPLSFGERVLARRAVEFGVMLVLAGPFDDAEVTSVEAVEVRAVGTEGRRKPPAKLRNLNRLMQRIWVSEL